VILFSYFILLFKPVISDRDVTEALESLRPAWVCTLYSAVCFC